MMNIYLTNLGKYNEGELIGEWVTLPVTEEELAAVKERIGINEEYEEFFITDYETDFNYPIGEFESIEKLNEIAEQMEEMDETEEEVYKALLADIFDDEEALEKTVNGDYMYYSDCSNMTDVAMAYAEETGLLDSIPENLRFYFDYEALGRDMNIEGHFIFLDNGDCIEVL